MKLKRYQTLSNLPDYSKTNDVEPEVSVPSSSSSTSSLNSTNKNNHVNQLRNNSHSYHQIHSTETRTQSNQINFSLSSQNTRLINTRIANSQSMNFQSNLSVNLSVLLNCNFCGKNIMNKSSSSSNLISNDTLQTWCLNCFKFLPQCVVCLRLMRINLGHWIPQSNINRVHTTPKLFRSDNEQKKISVQNKSPSQMDIHGLVDKNFHLDRYGDEYREIWQGLNKEVRQQVSDMSKVEIIYSKNFFLLKNTKFGNWFSWCMSCHHGGHIKHLINWFKTNQKCPYLHCKCSCTTLDHVFE